MAIETRLRRKWRKERPINVTAIKELMGGQ